MALVLWLWLFVAHGRTVAVMPLEPAVTSEVYDGLGLALAGMIVTDLAQIPDLELVERTQIDALLSEIDLGKQGFLDPKSAAQLGKGVGAELVVLGSWSTIESIFLIDLRAVEVKSGKIRSAAKAAGTVDDFVSVEKEVVESLLTSLKVEVSGAVRRKVLGQSPTESFEAVKAYGAGLKAEQDEDYAKAKAQFEAAAKADPGFDLPARRIAALGAQLQSLKEQQRQARKDAKTTHLELGVSRAPDELSLVDPSDPDEFAQLRIRWTFLNYLDRPCQAYRELSHAVARHKGTLPDTEQSYNRMIFQAKEMGLVEGDLYPWDGRLKMPRTNMNDTTGDILFRAIGTTPYSLVIDIVDGIDRAPQMGPSLVNLALTCAGTDPQKQVGALLEVRKLVRQVGWLEVQPNSTSIQDEIEALELDARVRTEGMTASIEKRLQVMIGRGRSQQSDADHVRGVALRWNKYRNVRGGLDLPTTHQIITDAAAGKISFEGACAPMQNARYYPERTAEVLEKGVTGRTMSKAQSALLQVHQLQRLGCVPGAKTRLDTTGKALAWLDTLPARFKEGGEKCAEEHAEAVESSKSARTPYPGHAERDAAHIIRRGLQLASYGCIDLDEI